MFAGVFCLRLAKISPYATDTATRVSFKFRGIDVSIRTLAGYAAYRSEGETYFKGKLGVLNEDVEIGSVSADDTGASYGLGVGWRQGNGLMIELEYTIIEQDVDFLSVGVSF